MTLDPGEGIILFNPTQTPFTIRFVGAVPQAFLKMPILQGWCIRSSLLPQSGMIATALMFPLVNTYIEEFYLMTGAAPGYSVYSNPGTAWVVPPGEPTMSVGEAFWSRSSYTGPHDWTRTFWIWP